MAFPTLIVASMPRCPIGLVVRFRMSSILSSYEPMTFPADHLRRHQGQLRCLLRVLVHVPHPRGGYYLSAACPDRPDVRRLPGGRTRPITATGRLPWSRHASSTPTLPYIEAAQPRVTSMRQHVCRVSSA